MSRFMGRATCTMIPNSLRRPIDWRKQIQLCCEQVERRVQKRGITEGKKLVFEEGEKVWVQCVKSGKWKDKERKKGDRIKHLPIKIKLKENSSIPPSHCSRPYDTPFHLRKAYTRELKNCLEAWILEKCGMEPSQWASKAFPVVEGNGKDVRIVSDFKQLNKAIERPHWPTESSDQLLRNIESDSRFFVTLDLTSGYHQVEVDKEFRNLLCIMYSENGRDSKCIRKKTRILSVIYFGHFI